MKKFLVLFVAISLMLRSLQQQADARLLANKDKPKLATEHQLARQTRDYEEAKDATSSGNKTDGSDSNYDDDDDTNQSYGEYGNSNGSTTESHHYFPNDQKPIKN